MTPLVCILLLTFAWAGPARPLEYIFQVISLQRVTEGQGLE